VPPSFFADIAVAHGTPVYIVWERIFRENCRIFTEQFQCGSRQCISAYSYKTNNLAALCAMAHDEGFGAEVVSPAELDMALRLAVPVNMIFFNGPLKTDESIKEAIRRGIAIHVDSLIELRRALDIAGALQTRAILTLRITPEFPANNGPIWNKFGLSLREGELDDAITMMGECQDGFLAGLHMHMGTNITDAAVYERGCEALADAFRKVAINSTMVPQYIDIGGGFSADSGAVPYGSHGEEWRSIAVSNVASIVTKCLNKIDPHERLRVVTEPGRILAEPAVALLARVISVKPRQPRPQVIIDGGTNILPTAYYTRHPISFPGNQSSATHIADIHGPLCTQHDAIAIETPVPELVPGDLVSVHGVGAYASSFSCQFVGPRPPTVSWDGKTLSLVREREPLDVLWQYDKHIRQSR